MSKRIYENWCVLHKDTNPTSCVLALPGRDQSGFDMAFHYDVPSLQDVLVIGVTPENLEWYPLPNGANDQRAAVQGQMDAVQTIARILRAIERNFGIRPENTALAGYSAGAVMAIMAGVHLTYTFPAIVAHAGAILEPDYLPRCRNKTPFFLFHNRDDSVFSWEERFLPMKSALQRQEYDVSTYEGDVGKHFLSQVDTSRAAQILADKLRGSAERVSCDVVSVSLTKKEEQ